MLQTGVLPPHWPFVLQATQIPSVASHTGDVPEHLELLVAEQTPQAPEG